MGEFKRIGNVKQFLELHTRHAQALTDEGYVFRDPIPVALKPFTRSLGPWPGNDDMAWDFLHPENEGRAVAPTEKARGAGFDTWQIVGKPPIEHAGHTYRISPKEDFRHGGMSMQIAQQKIRQPSYEWNKAAARELFNILTSGAFKAASAARTEDYVWTLKNFQGSDVAIAKATNSATVGTPTVAHSSHLIQFPDKQGGLFAAGHDHVPANAGGVWTEALGKTARDHILEHPGNNGVLAYVGANVVDEIEAVIETVRAGTGEGNQFEKEGATEDEFGVPIFIGRHDAVDYYRLDCLPDDLGVYLAKGRKILGLATGIQRADGNEMPKAWNDMRDPETEVINYGYRGPAAGHVINPTAVYIDRYTA